MRRREKEEKKLEKYPCPEKDDLGTAGVLLSDEIEHYAKKYRMIAPFHRGNLKPAAYELTVGNEYAIGGEIKRLYDVPGRNEIRIPPFQVVVIKTGERLNLPRFLIARWNIRVKWAYEGLLWVGGPQVDPGWVGYLPCPIYNLSDKEVTLKLGNSIAVMDFVKTTPFNKGKCVEYPRPPKRIFFDEYEPQRLKSALFAEAKGRIDDIEERVHKFQTRSDISMGIILGLVAILFTALAIFVSSSQEVYPPLYRATSWWTYLSAIFSLVAIIFSVIACCKARSKHRGDSNGKDNKL